MVRQRLKGEVLVAYEESCEQEEAVEEEGKS